MLVITTAGSTAGLLEAGRHLDSVPALHEPITALECALFGLGYNQPMPMAFCPLGSSPLQHVPHYRLQSVVSAHAKETKINVHPLATCHMSNTWCSYIA